MGQPPIRRRLGLIDAVAILLLIAILGIALGSLISARNPAVAARAESLLRAAASHVNTTFLSPKEAEADGSRQRSAN